MTMMIKVFGLQSIRYNRLSNGNDNRNIKKKIHECLMYKTPAGERSQNTSAVNECRGTITLLICL